MKRTVVNDKGRILLLLFSVTPFKIDKKKAKSFNGSSLESERRKTVAIQRLSPRFRSQRFLLCKICVEAFPPNLQRFV